MTTESPSHRIQRGLLELTGRLPLAVLHALALAVSCVFSSPIGYRRHVVMENLEAAFPERNARELTVLAKSFYRHLTDTAAEMLRARYMPLDAITCRIHIAGGDVLRSASDNFTRPLLVLTIHQGNWEWMLHALSEQVAMPVVPVYKPLHNPAVDQFMREARGRFGAEPLSLANAGTNILRHRRETRCIVMLADQSPVPGEREHWIQFLGRPAAFHLGPFALARAAGAAIMFARCTRSKRGHYDLTFELLAAADDTAADEELLCRYAEAAESAIRAQPQSWLWSNRRWKRAAPVALS